MTLPIPTGLLLALLFGFSLKLRAELCSFAALLIFFWLHLYSLIHTSQTGIKETENVVSQCSLNY